MVWRRFCLWVLATLKIIFKEKGNMKKIITLTAIPFIFASSLVSAGEYLNLKERQALLCNKPTHGVHMKSGWEWEQKSNSTCDRIAGKYIKGKKEGSEFDRRITGYPNGEVTWAMALCIYLLQMENLKVST